MYRPLRIIATALELVGYLTIVLGFFAAVAAISSSTNAVNQVGAIIGGLLMVAFAGVARVVIDIADNTRPKS